MQSKDYIIGAIAVLGVFLGGLGLVGGEESQSVGGPNRTPNGNPQTNSNNRDVDFIIRGTSDNQLIYGDAGNDRVGISTSTPESLLHIDGGSSATTSPTIGDRSSGNGSTCWNVANSDGTAQRMYINGTSLVIEAGNC